MNKKRWSAMGRQGGTGVLLMLAAGLAASQAQPGPGNPLDTLPAPQLQPAERSAGQIQAPPKQGEDILARKLVPRQFDIVGVRSIEFANVAREFAPLAGREITVADVVQTARDVTRRYRDEGYALSYAYVPEQDFRDGVVRVVVVEGYIADLEIQGDVGKSEALLREMAEPLLSEKPLLLETFERQTRLMARLPGVTVSASAPLPKTTDGRTTLQVQGRRRPVTVSVGASLRQAVSRPVVAVTINDPVFGGDQLQLSTLMRPWNEERLFSANYLATLGAGGNTLRLGYSDYRGIDQQIPATSGIRTVVEQRRIDVAVTHPWRLRASEIGTVEAGVYLVDYKRIDSLPGTGAWLGQAQRTGAAFARVGWSKWGEHFNRSVAAALMQGIDGAGARTRRTSSAGSNILAPDPARLDFTRLTLDAVERRRLGDSPWGGAVTVGGQYSPHVLPTSERVSFGGGRFGRAYPAGQIAGDSGLGAGVELNRTFSVPGSWLKHWDPYLLFEYARTWERTSGFAGSRIRSASVGMRFGDRRHYVADFAISKPLNAMPSNPRRKMRFSLELTYNFSEL